MRVFTKNLALFALCCAGITNLFYFGIGQLHKSQMANYSFAILGVVYGIVMFIVSWYWGKRDYDEYQIFDIGIRFHTTTYLLCNSIAFLWGIYILQSEVNNIRPLYMTALWWGLGLALHYIIFFVSRKQSIKGYNKDEIFD